MVSVYQLLSDHKLLLLYILNVFNRSLAAMLVSPEQPQRDVTTNSRFRNSRVNGHKLWVQ